MTLGDSIDPATITHSRSIAILVPALNEEKNIEPTIERIIDALSITVEDYEIIIINDGSSDSTGLKADQIAKQYPNIRVFHNNSNMGLGYCYATGYRETNKTFFVYIPGDNTWPARSFIELFGNLGRADVVTSYASNPEVRPFARRWVSKIYTKVLNVLFGRRLRYFNGLTIYPVDFLRKEPATTFGFGFQAEVLLKALALGLSYIEIPLGIDQRTAGHSKAVNIRNISSVAATIARTFIELRYNTNWRPDAAVQSPVVSAALAECSISQVIVITGASTGIGRALAIDLARAGHRIVVCSRNMPAMLSAFSDEDRVSFFECDVTSEQAVLKFVKIVSEEVDRVDVLINCAGGFGAIGPIDRVDSAEWLATINSNLFSAFLTVKWFLPLLEKSKIPHVINFSGGGAFSPFANFSAYAASKTALVRLTETLAIELLNRGISVNAVAPGFIPTKAHKAILDAGPAKAGAVQFKRAERLFNDHIGALTDQRLGTVIKCIRALISSEYRGLTGKTISANFDPWSTSKFRAQIRNINKSDLYTMRRINVVNLSDGLLRDELINANNSD